MKNKFVLLFMIVSGLSFADDGFSIRIGGDITSKTNSMDNYTDGNTEDFGYEIGVEYTKSITDKFSLGLGTAYQNHAKFSGEESGYSKFENDGSQIIENEYSKGFDDFTGYHSVPIYLTGKYILTNRWSVKPYIKGNIGYSFNFGNENLKYSDKVERENESTDTDLGGHVFESYTLSTSVKDGYYYGAGLGLSYYSLAVEALYQVNTSKMTVNNKEYKNNYERVSVILNYTF
nr:hypothetical protein [uncultured Cetobacterium sp.]